MAVIHKYKNYKKQEAEKIPSTSLVDRTGYISPEMQLERLETAGANLKRIHTEQYSYDFQNVVDALQDDKVRELVSNTLVERGHYDKRDLDDMLKIKLNKVEKAKKTEKYITEMEKKFNDLHAKREEDTKKTNMYNDIINIVKDLKQKGEL